MPESAPPYLQLRALRKDYGVGAAAVDHLDLDIAKGELVGLLGPSGCGKTTTLRMIAGLVSPTFGQILLDGRDLTAVPTHRRNVGMVFQNYALFPHMTVAANVAFGLQMRAVQRSEIRARVAEALALVRLEGFENRKPRALSGGQQQRVALARALVIHPDLLLLDEPLSNLDAKLREEMRDEIRDIQKRLAITTVFVTHDQTEALTLCDRIAVIDQGRLVQFGAPEDVYERPATPFVARFVGRINTLPGRIETAGSGPVLRVGPTTIPLPQPASLSPGEPAALMIRPQYISVTDAATPVRSGTDREISVSGCIAKRVYIGDIVQLEITGDGFTLLAECGSADPHWRGLAVGHPVQATWPASAMLLFPGGADREP
jgi:putative spermidine/putrescine transport system ATP-binding protein